MIAAVETRYAGCRFRSRLEARWAVFFDHLGIRWEYEPQGYDLDRLARALADRYGDDDLNAMVGMSAESLRTCRLGLYLPDFYLPAQRLWFEVKGSSFAGLTEDRLTVFGALTPAVGQRFVVFVGDVPRDASDDEHGFLYGPHWDNYHQWCRCSVCGSYDVQFSGRSERNYCRCIGPTGPRDFTGDHPSILAAYTAARSARFEHREAPAS